MRGWISSHILERPAKNGVSFNKTRLLIAQDTTPIVADNKIKCAFAYEPKTDTVRYNKKNKDFKKYDTNYVLTHEYTHKIDKTELKSWENVQFVNAIGKARKTLYNNVDIIKEWFSDGGIYEYNGAVSDIISALSKGKLNEELNLMLYHIPKYWNDYTVATETMANITCIDMSNDEHKEFKALFGELFDGYNGVVEWKK